MRSSIPAHLHLSLLALAALLVPGTASADTWICSAAPGASQTTLLGAMVALGALAWIVARRRARREPSSNVE